MTKMGDAVRKVFGNDRTLCELLSKRDLHLHAGRALSLGTGVQPLHFR